MTGDGHFRGTGDGAFRGAGDARGPAGVDLFGGDVENDRHGVLVSSIIRQPKVVSYAQPGSGDWPSPPSSIWPTGSDYDDHLNRAEEIWNWLNTKYGISYSAGFVVLNQFSPFTNGLIRPAGKSLPFFVDEEIFTGLSFGNSTPQQWLDAFDGAQAGASISGPGGNNYFFYLISPNPGTSAQSAHTTISARQTTHNFPFTAITRVAILARNAGEALSSFNWPGPATGWTVVGGMATLFNPLWTILNTFWLETKLDESTDWDAPHEIVYDVGHPAPVNLSESSITSSSAVIDWDAPDYAHKSSSESNPHQVVGFYVTDVLANLPNAQLDLFPNGARVLGGLPSGTTIYYQLAYYNDKFSEGLAAQKVEGTRSVVRSFTTL